MTIPLALSFLLASAAFGDYHRTLKTPHYTIRITERCDEGVVGCDNVLYQATSTSGKSITLHGKQIEHMCAGMPDTPCHPVGYEFHKGAVVFFVGEDGSLSVTQGRTILVDEKGTWIDE